MHIYPQNRRRRRGLLLVVAIAALATVGPALALTRHEHDSPPGVQIAYERAHPVATSRTASGTVRLWEAPTDRGGVCTFLQVGGSGAAPAPNGGAACDLGAHRPQSIPIQTAITWVGAAGASTALVDGSVVPAVKRLELRTAAGSQAVALVDGFFLVTVDGVATNRVPDGATLVGYDANGAVVAKLSLEQVIAAATPPS